MKRLVVVSFCLAMGCDPVPARPVDAGDPDAVAADASPDAPPPPMTAPSTVAQTAGGGAASSTSYRVQLQFGAPQPMGRTSSAGFRATLGTVRP